MQALPECIDSHIRFTATWGGHDRYIFVLDRVVNDDAGRSLTRRESELFVADNLDRYIEEAKALIVIRSFGLNRIITIDRSYKEAV